MKKILIVFIAVLSLVLMPMGVKATSYKDYFTIESYYKGENFRSLTIKVPISSNLNINEETNFTDEITGSFLIENETGEFDVYSNGKFYNGAGDVDHALLYLTDEGLNKDATEAKIQMIIDVNLQDYKSKLTIDLSKAIIEETGVIANLDEIVTEELVGTGTTPEEPEKVEDKVVEVTSNNLVSKDLLNEIKTNGNKVTYETKKDGKLNYAWTFDGAKMTTNELDVNLELIVNAEDEVGISKLIPKTQEKPLILDFKHSGVLPVGTKVKVNVADTYKDGDKLTLYYYNETTKKLEEKVTNIEVKDGFVEFSLEHCSTYTLVRENTAPNNAYTASMNVYLYSGLAAISLIGIILLVKTSKKKIA